LIRRISKAQIPATNPWNTAIEARTTDHTTGAASHQVANESPNQGP